jgi:Spy/CpxP family protein refolding chaperone
MNEQSNEQLQLLKKMHRWRLAFFGIVILAAGMVIGAAVAMVYKTAVTVQHPEGIEFVDTHTMKRLKRDLDLTEEQSHQIGKIFNDHMKSLSDIRRQARPQIAEEMNALYTDVLEVLDDNQQEKWKKSIRRLREHIGSRRGRGRKGDGSGRGMRSREHGGRWQHRPFEMWEQKGDGDGPMRRGRGGGMRPRPDGFEPPPEQDEGESNDN